MAKASHTVSHFEYRVVVDGEENADQTSCANAETFAEYMRGLDHTAEIQCREVTTTYGEWA